LLRRTYGALLLKRGQYTKVGWFKTVLIFYITITMAKTTHGHHGNRLENGKNQIGHGTVQYRLTLAVILKLFSGCKIHKLEIRV
jgi:hypothetical protein